MAVRYRHHRVCLVRSTTDPGDLDLPDDIDLSDPEAVDTEGKSWLARTGHAVRSARPLPWQARTWQPGLGR